MPDATDIHAFLGHCRWKQRFDDDHLAAAQPLMSKVRDLRIEEAGEGAFCLLGSVAAEDTEVSIWQNGGSWDFETTCHCEIGSYCPGEYP